MKRRWCLATPRQGTVDGTHATCVCGKPLTFVSDLINQASHWRHHPRKAVIR